MLVEEKVIKTYSFQFEDNSKFNNILTLKNGDMINYPTIHVNGYDLNFIEKRGELFATFGCFQCTQKEAELGFKNLTGVDTSEEVPCLISKKTKRKSNVDFKEEAGDYYISKSLRAYPKKEWELGKKTLKNKILFAPGGYYRDNIVFKGYSIGYMNTITHVNKVLQYVLEVFNHINPIIAEYSND